MGYLDVEVEPNSLRELALLVAFSAMESSLKGFLEP
jgi:hypothetical protein